MLVQERRKHFFMEKRVDTHCIFSTYTRCIKYWLNILRMREDRIPLKSYKKCFIICTVTTKTTGPPLFASHCIDTDMDMFGKTRVSVI